MEAHVFQEYICHPWKPEENTRIPQPVYVSRIGDIMANRNIFVGCYKKNFISWTHDGSTSLVQNRSCLVAKTGDVFKAISPAEMKSTFHRLMKIKGCSLLKVRFHAKAFKISEKLSSER